MNNSDSMCVCCMQKGASYRNKKNEKNKNLKKRNIGKSGKDYEGTVVNRICHFINQKSRKLRLQIR